MKKILKPKKKGKELKKPEVEAEMGFLDHLEQLRWHILRSVAAIFFFAILVFLAKEFVFETVIMGPTKEWFPTWRFFCFLGEGMCFAPPDLEIIPRQLGEQFYVHLKSSIVIGVIISFPYIFWEVWRFVKPGLYAKEQKYAKGIVFICSMLFMIGVTFGYFVVGPFGIKFLAGYSVGDTVSQTTSLTSYVGFVTMTTLPAGIVFELPIVVYFLSKIGLITPEFMRKYRKHAIVVILVFAAIITPPDILTQFLIGIPVYILYEISILVSKRVQPDLDD